MIVVLLLLGLSVHTNENSVQSLNSDNKVFLITLDGLRWQEVFNGADSTLLQSSEYNKDATATSSRFWASTAEDRRKKLMPFLWTMLANNGTLYGNRQWDNKVNTANPYALSYPGYNELLTGQVDFTIYGNGKTVNKNRSVLHFLADSKIYSGRVAAFTSWDAFPYILAKEDAGFYINSGYVQPEEGSGAQLLLTHLQPLDDQKNTRPDEITFLACKEYVERKKPSVVLLGLGGTDEAAHEGHYDEYLQQAANADRMIGDLWLYLQSLPEYRGKTSFIITTDHGRGSSADNWYTHGIFTAGSSQTWMALLGKGIMPSGEQRLPAQRYQKDVKDLLLQILSLQ